MTLLHSQTTSVPAVEQGVALLRSQRTSGPPTQSAVDSVGHRSGSMSSTSIREEVSLNPVDDAIIVEFLEDLIFVIDIVMLLGQTEGALFVVMSLLGVLVAETVHRNAVAQVE